MGNPKQNKKRTEELRPVKMVIAWQIKCCICQQNNKLMKELKGFHLKYNTPSEAKRNLSRIKENGCKEFQGGD